MSEIAISLNNVSKCYRRYAHPADRVKALLWPRAQLRSQEFWALRGINFDVVRGQTFGLVGRNGSGKSTLLRIIAGTLAPTAGSVRVNGRLSALLELGSGFNPEFTGRQNVWFNGQILGLTPREIGDRFDEIAAFAEIGDFLDRPVKTYSSGMVLRLAFAVATSVDPDILIVDEALSVGDEVFQRKCFARIQSIQERGGTILFVSHSARLVIELCNQAALLDGGELLLRGSPKFIVSKYQKLIYAPKTKWATLRQEIRSLAEPVEDKESATASGDRSPPGNGHPEPARSDSYDPNLVPSSTVFYHEQGARIEGPRLETLDGKRVNVIQRGNEYIYSYTVVFSKTCHRVRFGMLIKTKSGFKLGGGVSHTPENALEVVPGNTRVRVEFSFRCLLVPGAYFLNAGVVGTVGDAESYLHRCIDVAMFRVQPETAMLATTLVDFEIASHVRILSPPTEVSPG